MVMNLLTVQ